MMQDYVDDEVGLAISYIVMPEAKKVIRSYVNVESPYVRDLVQHAFVAQDKVFMHLTSENPELLWDEYENLDWQAILKGKVIANSYCIRKGISRKAQLSIYLQKYIQKRPKCVIQKALPRTIAMETWDAHGPSNGFHMPFRQRLEGCLWEAKEIFEERGGTWILKPSATNKGAEVNVVTSYKQVFEVVYEWTDIREWVLQEYIERPLLINQKKFHIRTYVLAVGSLKVFVYQDMLILTAMEKYNADQIGDSYSHITNTFLQQEHPDFREEDCVLLLEDLQAQLEAPEGKTSAQVIDKIREDIGKIVADLFDAYRGEFAVFQPLPNCFEIYGLDFIVDEDFNVWFLEVNPGPDFKQTGDRLQHVIAGLMKDTVSAVTGHFCLNSTDDQEVGRHKKVYDDKWGYRAKQSATMNFT